VIVVDLFSGLGSLSLGVVEAARALGSRAEIGLAADADPAVLDVLSASLAPPPGTVRCVDLEAALAGRGERPTTAERTLLSGCPEAIDVLVAGPPCQGHSRLNNYTRHDDPRNDLYARVVRFVELRRPRFCIVENVDSVVHDQRHSAAIAARRLRDLSYRVDTAPVVLQWLGVPQTRRRHVLVATRADQRSVDVRDVLATYAVGEPELRTVRWAIGDLVGKEAQRSIDLPSSPTPVNLKRMRWLHRTPAYDLPNDLRPDCHRLPRRTEDGEARTHSYASMYGRLRWDQPAQTITSGFGSMGQGRYVHPGEPRTLTPHEAGRLQLLPDFVELERAPTRSQWARMIGNVAPMKLSYVFALEFLR